MPARQHIRLNDTAGQLAELQKAPTRLAMRLERLLEDCVIRLERRLRDEGKDWAVTGDYLRGVGHAVVAGCRLLKEIRQQRSEMHAHAETLGDLQLRETFRDALRRELRDLDDAEFLALLSEREQREKAEHGDRTPDS